MTNVPYRPSNGTEGDIFHANWCAHCTAEKAYRDSGGDEDGCDIIPVAYALPIDHPDYPVEWRKDGPLGPRCTAFRAGDDDSLPLDPAAVVRPLL